MDELEIKRIEKIFSRQFPELSKEKIREAAVRAEDERPFLFDEEFRTKYEGGDMND